MTASAYKTILVHQDSLPRSEARLELAISLAERMGAHLVGIHPSEAVSMPGYAAVELGGSAISEMRQLAANREKEAAARFENRLKRASGITYEWVASSDSSAGAVTRLAHYVDLTVLGQTDAENLPVGQPRDFLEEAILQPGGPALVVPHSGTFNAIGGVAVVGWNRSRESARAIKDAIPLLKLAREVVVVTTRSAPSPETPTLPAGTEVARFLSRHGIRAEAVEHRGVDIDRGEWLLSRTADLSAELVVMGAYGHSRLRELVLGGVTRTFLQSMTVPVLMSH